MSDRDWLVNDCNAPEVYRGQVLADWIDVNAHMNVAYYLLAFDYGIDGLWHEFGLSAARREQSGDSTFAVESHIQYLNELTQDEGYLVKSQVLAFDDKRIHQLQYLFSSDSGKLAATCEWLHLHVDLNTRRVTPWPDDLLANIARHPCTHTGMAWPAAAGRQIRVSRPIDPAELS